MLYEEGKDEIGVKHFHTFQLEVRNANTYPGTLREESSQTNVTLQYKLLASILMCNSTVIVCIALLLHII